VGAHAAGDGRETTVSTVIAPRLRWNERHDDGGSDAGVTTGAVVWTAAAEVAHDATGARAIAKEARSPARAPTTHGTDGGRETAAKTATSAQLWAGESRTHDDGGRGTGVTMGALAAAAADAWAPPGAGGVMAIARKAQSLSHSPGAHEASGERVTTATAASSPRLRARESLTHDDGGSGETITVTRRKHSGYLWGEHAAGQAGVKPPRQPSRSVSFPLAGGAATVAPPPTQTITGTTQAARLRNEREDHLPNGRIFLRVM